MLIVRDLNIRYGGIEAVRGISFDVPDGKIVTLVGANGAGKSSTLRSIIGLVKPSGGSILLRDSYIRGRRTDEIVSQGITLVPEGRHVFPDQTVLENLTLGPVKAGGVPQKQAEETAIKLLTRVGLAEKALNYLYSSASRHSNISKSFGLAVIILETPCAA